MALTLDYRKDNGAIIAGAYVKIAAIIADSSLRIADSYETRQTAALSLAIYGSAAARVAEAVECWGCVTLDPAQIATLPATRDEALSAAYAHLKTLADFAKATDC